MPPPNPKPTLLTIPLELRYTIYEMIFYRTVGPQPLLHVCRQIRTEALSILLHFVRFFDSLHHLSQWTSKGPPDLLPLVRILDINCLESSLAPFRDWQRRLIPGVEIPHDSWEETYLSRLPGKLSALRDGKPSMMQKLKHSVTSTMTMSARSSREPVTTLAHTLTKLPGVRNLSLTFSGIYSVDDKDPLLLEQGLVLEMGVRLLPGLRELAFQAGPVELGFLAYGANLRRLEFPGYATTGPAETLRILSSLPRLEALVLKRPPASNDLDNGMESQGVQRRVAVTGEVVEGLKGLKEIGLVHFAGELKSEFVTGGMMRAIRAHEETLEVLHVDHDGVMDDEAARELQAVLPRLRKLRKIYLDFVLSEDLEGDYEVKELIPPNVQIVKLRIV
ncbi:hypothetical protein P170DRAFT_477378 [Aspergillus steynii IBT 23096]|uniref:F-box domain-containing protein n=1 Tax=Aspergillus steynii IBT 23096 TaxID=1392250 RepID=A0A2I2G0U8_9EURO|nr:uncharacterized protein P170DRAFT_477378 [Aspergillus steynii IBT 23096]PLB46498.1 hypothetical protein P170DRAFT_477378 [Aspergillus steynii IBT 23096]